MNLRQLQEKLPAVTAWIDRTLAAHVAEARPVDSFGFKRLGSHYPATLLAGARAIPVARVPVPPLASLGLPGFAGFEQLEAAGITYRSAYFVSLDHARDESLHFHELVHVVQWQHLGAEGFLSVYALGYLLGGGYRTNPMEVMAYDLQERFDQGGPPFDVVSFVQSELDRFVPALLRRGVGVGGPDGHGPAR